MARGFAVDGTKVSTGPYLRWDRNGNLTEDAQFAYRYDWANRLVIVTKKVKAPSSGHDAQENVVIPASEPESSADRENIVMPGSDPASSLHAFRAWSFAFDPAGNPSSDGLESGAYDALGRLTSADQPWKVTPQASSRVSPSEPEGRGMDDEGSRREDDRRGPYGLDDSRPGASFRPLSSSQSFDYTSNGNRETSLEVRTLEKTVTTCKNVTTGTGRNRKTTKVCTDSVSALTDTGGTSYVQGSANEYARLDKVDGTKVSTGSFLRWDKNGNITEDTKFAYRYDWANRLVMVTKKVKAPSSGHDAQENVVIPAPEPESSADVISGDSSDESSSEDDEDDTSIEPVFPPFAEKSVAQYRYDALGRRVQARDGSKFATASGATGLWVSAAANQNGTRPEAPALTGGTLANIVFAGQNDVAKLDASGKVLSETAYRDPLSYDAPVAYFRLEKSRTWVPNPKGRGGKFVTTESWVTRWYHLDRLGSVVAISDKDGKILEQYRYDPFGKPYVLKADGRGGFVIPAYEPGSRGKNGNSPAWKPLSKPGLGNSKLYAGRDYDQATKTYWYRARQYSPDLGRFLQRDPLGYADGANPYAYVANGPWGATDPSGRKAKTLIILALDHGDVFPQFDSDGLTKNWEGSYVASQFNSVAGPLINSGVRFDVKIVTRFDQFDDAINEKQRLQIYLIAHGSPDNITLSEKQSAISNPDTPIFFKINGQALNLDIQTASQAERLSSTELILLSCNTGNTNAVKTPIAQSLQSHYGFLQTRAPSTYIYAGGEIYDETVKWAPTINNWARTDVVRENGEMNIFH